MKILNFVCLKIVSHNFSCLKENNISNKLQNNSNALTKFNKFCMPKQFNFFQVKNTEIT